MTFKQKIAIVATVFCLTLAGCKKKNSDQIQESELDKQVTSSVSKEQESSKYKIPDLEDSNVNESSLALVGDNTISVEMLKAYLDSRPRSDYVDNDEFIRSSLDDLAMSEALYQEASRLGLENDPHLRQQIQQILIQSLLNRQVEQPIHEAGISDQEMQQYYQDHLNEYSRGAQRRVAYIYFAVKTSDERETRKALADQVLAKALAGRVSEFGDLIGQYSDTPERFPKGDTGYFDENGDPVGLNPELVEAAFALQRPGQICERLIETEEGFFVIMLITTRAALEKSFDEMKIDIRNLLYRQKLEQARIAYLNVIRDNANIVIHEKTVEDFIKQIPLERSNSVPVWPLR